MTGFGEGSMRGVIPRSVELITSEARRMAAQGWDYEVSASFLEIYNEKLKDLLIPSNSDMSEEDLAIRMLSAEEGGGKGRTVHVPNLTTIPLPLIDEGECQLEVFRLMTLANQNRSTASTKMNHLSSRSHSIFMLDIVAKSASSNTTLRGTLHLCDLAGSERLDRSGAGEDVNRLKETQSINKSLSCLVDVFSSLASKSSHIPFRNSKLTYLLKDCFSGDGKALMMVNLSPTPESTNESLCSLRFAKKVGEVELGKAKRHISLNQDDNRRKKKMARR